MRGVVREVRAADTASLRREVLRSGRPGPLPGDHPDDEPAFHLAAYAGSELLGTGNVRLKPAPWTSDGPAWRLRGMATAPQWQSQGVGAGVLAGLVAHCTAQGGRLLWCNARTPAQQFYERAGLVVIGQAWEDPEIGPHVRMWRAL